MSVQATSWVWNHSQAEGTARLVLLAIADAANREGRNSCQSANTIAEMCRVSKRTVRYKISELLATGELGKEGKNGEYGTTVYYFPKMVEDAPKQGGANSAPGANLAGANSAPGAKSAPGGCKTEPQGVQMFAHNPINPSSSKELHPINNAHEGMGERQRPAPGRVHYSPAFEQFWEAYPRKEGKLDAYNAWRSASHFNNASHLIAAAGRYRDNPNRDPRYTKTPTRWLNTRGWEDGPAEPPRPQQPTNRPWAMTYDQKLEATQNTINQLQAENHPPTTQKELYW